MPLRLSIQSRVLNGPTGEPKESSDAQRTEWTRKMQYLLAGHPTGGRFHADFETDEGNLHLQARRFGSTIVAIWSIGTWSEDVTQEIAGASLLLLGKNPKDDSDALEAFSGIEALSAFPRGEFNQVQTQSRPCLAIFYPDPKWHLSGCVELAATSLAMAIMAAPGVTPTVLPADRA